jgi:adenylate cyclase
MDLRFGPLGQLPGVEVHAQALEQALGGHSLQRPAWALGLEACALLLGCGLLAWLALRRAALVAASGALTLLALALGLAWWAFVAHGLLLDAATPALAWLLCYLLCSLWQQRQREHQQRWIRQAFARYVSPNRVAWLLAHPQAFVLGGRRQQCSFVFTDLTGFTALMERLDPAQAVGLLNTYLDAMVAIAFRFEGTLDRIVGDAVAIMFSAPVEQADHRARALACALEMDAFAVRFARQQQGIALGQTRIGVHCGEVIVGNFGGQAVFDYRALGDPVNTAARLESANKQLGTRVCVSEEILRGQVDVPVRPVGRVLLQGKRQALAVFEPLSTSGADAEEADAQRAPLPDYLLAFEAMQNQQAGALDLFAQLARAWPHDPLVRLHHGRLLSGEWGDHITLREK